MKIYIRFFVFILFLIPAYSKLSAQYLEFIENKGQWDSKVTFTGELNGGAFYLQKNGYKVLLNSNADWEKISDYFAGHSHNESKTNIGDHPRTDDMTDGGGKEPGSQTQPPTKLPLVLHSHTYEVTFVGGNANPEIVPDKKQDSYNNFYIGTDTTKWATGCRVYQAVVYKNIYPNIDIRYYTDNSKLKYDFIVHPGGDVSKIALQFEGATSLSLKKGNLIVHTSISDVTELAPISYQSGSVSKTNVNTSFALKDNVVRFKTDAYDKTQTLIIDPTVVFITFSGSKSDNWGYTATYDGDENLYAGGIVFGSVGSYPVTTGAFQTTFGGGDNTITSNIGPIDISLTKFNKNASVRLYSTYLGGSGDEQPHSMIVDRTGSLIISGSTSSANFPSTISKYGPGGGGFDIFLTKFNSDGSLNASRIFGGSNYDGINYKPKYVEIGPEALRKNYGDDARSEVITDNAGNIYLASCTQSANFPVTPNAFQSTFGGIQDGVIIKTSPNLSTVLLSSFLGGSQNDASYVLTLSPAEDQVYIAGATQSANMPGISNGPLLSGTFKGGGIDGFVSLIDNSTYALLKTTYVGTASEDMIYGIQMDKFGFPYVMGTTRGTWPIVNAAWKQTNGKQFIGKLKKDLSGWEYTTVFGRGGTTPDISPIAFLVDRCENVYVSGWGGGINQVFYSGQTTVGLSMAAGVTPIQSTTDGKDFYFFVLKRNAADQLYGSFFGQNGGLGDHVDGGTSRFDKQGVIYQAICANCGRDVPFRTTPGVAGPYNNASSGSQCNLAALKLAFQLAGIGNGVRASIEGREYDTSGCVPLLVNFVDTLNLGKQFVWKWGDGKPDTTTLTPSASHTFDAIGDYKVMLVSIDSSTCNIADTSYTTIRVRRDKAILGLTSTKLPPCTSLAYQFTNTSTFPTGKPFNSRSFAWDFGDGTVDTAIQVPPHTYKAEGTYIVKLYLIDSNYCNAPDLLVDTLRIAANVAARFQTPPVGCAPYLAEFNNTTLAGQTFIWNFGDGATSTEEYPTHLYEIPGTYTVTLQAFDPSTCNKEDDTSMQIIVSPKPIAAFSFEPIPAQENTFTTFHNLSTGGTNYKWIFGDGDELETVRLDTLVKHIYNRTDTFTVQLIAYNNFGCTDTAEHGVASIILPLVDVPNALAPNGTNRYINVQGYGIDKMDWKIFNRWGKMVFHSTSQKTPWDGTYNGVLQPQEVYTYVLDVVFTDGKKYRKTGDITLLR